VITPGQLRTVLRIEPSRPFALCLAEGRSVLVSNSIKVACGDCLSLAKFTGEGEEVVVVGLDNAELEGLRETAVIRSP
jgi:hypothetical protein